MTTFRDKIKETRKGFSTIDGVVSFSGADISVIAYRNETPVSKFKVEALKKDVEKKETEIQAKRKEKAVTATELASSAEDLQVAQDQLAKRRDQLRASGVPENSTALSNINNREGKFQKRVSDAAAADAVSSGELVDLNGELDGLNKELSDLNEVENYFQLGSIHTLSYSSFREKFAVRTLARIQAKTYTRGPRTIAGSMVFNVFQEHEFLKMVDFIDDTGGPHPGAVMIDQVQPFNLLLLFANEFGAYSALHLLNVDISSEGQEMSIDNILTHNTMNYYATDMIPMTNLGNRFNSYDEMLIGTIRDISQSGFSSGKTSNRTKIDSLVNPFLEEGAEVDLISQSRGLF